MGNPVQTVDADSRSEPGDTQTLDYYEKYEQIDKELLEKMMACDPGMQKLAARHEKLKKAWIDRIRAAKVAVDTIIELKGKSANLERWLSRKPAGKPRALDEVEGKIRWRRHAIRKQLLLQSAIDQLRSQRTQQNQMNQ